MYEIKNIDPVSLGRSLAVVGGSIFLALVVCFVIFMMSFGGIDLDDLFEEEVFMFFGGGLIITVTGFFIGSLAGAMIYNYISSRFGGVKLDIDYHKGRNEPLQDSGSNNLNVRQEVKTE
ncbi:MAG: hypothetical protein U9M90_01015 [Patescibacteria group bacterium]|nr:hypothetical protein [Patescibacteria group bacterium]